MELPERFCECGCGKPSGFYATTAKGHRKGEPRLYVNGHNWRGRRRQVTIDEKWYAIEDRGYTTPCWIWHRSLTPKGYGALWDIKQKRLAPAHRVLYERDIGPIPKGLQIDHLCRNRACVNPAHMEPVTQYVNQQRGKNAKLTREQADVIRLRGRAVDASRARGEQPTETLKAIAQEFGVSAPVVTGIARGHLWLT